MHQVALGLQTFLRSGAAAALAGLRSQAGERQVCAQTPAAGAPPAGWRCPGPRDPREGAPGPAPHLPKTKPPDDSRSWRLHIKKPKLRSGWTGEGGSQGSLHPVSQVWALFTDIDATALELMAAACFSLLIVFVFG